MFEPGETRKLSELGITGSRIDRRTAIKLGLTTAAAAGISSAATAPPAHAGLNKLAKANATRVRQLTGPRLTNRWAAPYVDLGIPVLTRRGMLLVNGDSFAEPGVDNANDWRAPTGLRSSKTALDSSGLVVDSAIEDRPGHAMEIFTNEDHHYDPRYNSYTTAIPTDVFRMGNRLYMHLMRGVLFFPDHSDFWYSDNDGDTWTYIRQWPADAFGGEFQQKSYAADTQASDPYIYVYTTVFQRDIISGLLLFRVRKDAIYRPDGYYEPWGFANGRWAWGNPPSTVTDRRYWGEICFRAMGGKYVLSWFQPVKENPDYSDIRAMVFPVPTADLYQTTEQTMVYFSTKNPSSEGKTAHVQVALYGGFIFPGSTFDNFHIAVSNWINDGRYSSQGVYDNYVVTQWRTKLNPNLHP